MAAHPVKSNFFEQTFCLVLSWMSALCDEHCELDEADVETGRIVVRGDAEVCSAFQSAAAHLIMSAKDPDEIWREL